MDRNDINFELSFTSEDDQEVWDMFAQKPKRKKRKWVEPPFSEEDAAAWRQYEWDKVKRHVRKKQQNIVRAYKSGDIEKILQCQRYLTKSSRARAYAIHIVTTNTGARTPGIDGVKWKHRDDLKYQAISQMDAETYSTKPYLRIYISKPGKTGKRPLSIPTMADRAMQTLYKLALEPVAETSADVNSFGYRRWRGTHDALAVCKRIMEAGAAWVISGDIKGCFDNIDHKWLLKNIPMDRIMLRKFLKCGYIERNGKYVWAGKAGISQGSPISSALCNMTLDGLRALVKSHDANMDVLRFADDLIVTSHDLAAMHNAIPLLNKFLQERGLNFSKAKTVLTSMDIGFDFLGFNFRNSDGNVVIEPSVRNVERILDSIEKAIVKYSKSGMDILISHINARLRGFISYNMYCTKKDAFLYVDMKVSLLLAKYGICPSVHASLLVVSDVENIKHVWVHPNANPFDSAWELYFEQWEYAKSFYKPKGYKRLAYYFNIQEGFCPVCESPIEGSFAIHKKIIGNVHTLEIMHQKCHAQIHGLKTSGADLHQK